MRGESMRWWWSSKITQCYICIISPLELQTTWGGSYLTLTRFSLSLHPLLGLSVCFFSRWCVWRISFICVLLFPSLSFPLLVLVLLVRQGDRNSQAKTNRNFSCSSTDDWTSLDDSWLLLRLCLSSWTFRRKETPTQEVSCLFSHRICLSMPYFPHISLLNGNDSPPVGEWLTDRTPVERHFLADPQFPLSKRQEDKQNESSLFLSDHHKSWSLFFFSSM